MEIKRIDDQIAVAGQMLASDMSAIAAAGYRSVICNRPDAEAPEQPSHVELQRAAEAAGLHFRFQPVASGKVSDQDVEAFGKALREMPRPLLAFCNTGTRSTTLWALDAARTQSLPQILAQAKAAGYDMNPVARRVANRGRTAIEDSDAEYQLVIVGGGAAGIAVAASILQRAPDVTIAIIDPADVHYYQPGWTMVGGGIFDAFQTVHTMANLIPDGVKWIRGSVVAFEPERNSVVLEGCRIIKYDRLIVCPGLKLDWDKVEGLSETLGRNGVTSNYRFDLAPYTWDLVKNLRSGRALFTQPQMPIKCAGAPQKAMYLSADHWKRTGRLQDIDISFMNAGGVLFGVKEYVPALMEYVKTYHAQLNFFHNLVAIDGPGKTATFEVKEPEKEPRRITAEFDMIHVCPPQTAPDFIRASQLADAAGWVDVDQHTLRHKRFDNIWSLGDVMSAPNAKTVAAARKQAPIVAENIIADIAGRGSVAQYDGYGSCPLTVERGKVVLAEFGYGGAILPTFPEWIVQGKKPSRLSWLLKARLLPPIYWKGMLRGHEWLAKPKLVKQDQR